MISLQTAATIPMMTMGDLIKMMSVIATFLSMVLAAVIKLVLNGTARRTRSIESTLNKHVETTATNLQTLQTAAQTDIKEVHGRINDLVENVGKVDVRLGRIEGSRWRRREDGSDEA